MAIIDGWFGCLGMYWIDTGKSIRQLTQDVVLQMTEMVAVLLVAWSKMQASLTLVDGDYYSSTSKLRLAI